jgi:predicted ATPase
MLSSFSIANFKAFGPAQEIPLRPITLVFGPNSAGKSSIIQSLLLARHIHDTGNADAHQTTLGGAAVDLGGFPRFVHRRMAELDLEVRLTFPRSNFPEQFHYFGKFETLTAAYTFGFTKPGADVRPKTVRILLDNIELLHFFLSEDGSLALDRTSPGFQSVLATVIERSKRGSAELFELLGESIPDNLESGTAEAWMAIIMRMRIQSNCLRLENLAPLPRERFDFDVAGSNADLDRPDWDPVGFYDRWLNSDDADEDEQSSKRGAEGFALRYDLECLIDAVDATVSEALAGIFYLGPLRWIPPRVIPDGEQFDASWRAGGGEAWQRLRRDSALLERVNRFLQDTLHSQYRLRCRQFVPQQDAETIQLCVKRALERSAAATAGNSASDSDTARVAEDAPPSVRAKTDASDLAAALESELRAQTTGEGLTELSLVDATTGLAVSHRDVGTGISQVVPILAYAAGKQQLIAIEQPELHLHPALQAELGDVFIESALGGNENKFLIETHSEHLILRIMRRIRESNAGKHGTRPRITPDDVAILFVQPTESGAVVKQLRVDEQGRLIDPWPGGFFGEAFDEIF